MARRSSTDSWTAEHKARRPDRWTQQETDLLLLGKQLGFSFELIQAKHLPGRTVRACVARFETLQKKGELLDSYSEPRKSRKRAHSTTRSPPGEMASSERGRTLSLEQDRENQRRFMCTSAAGDIRDSGRVCESSIPSRRAMNNGESSAVQQNRTGNSVTTSMMGEENDCATIIVSCSESAISDLSGSCHEITSLVEEAIGAEDAPTMSGPDFSRDDSDHTLLQNSISVSDEQLVHHIIGGEIGGLELYMDAKENNETVSRFYNETSTVNMNDLDEMREWLANFKVLELRLIDWKRYLPEEYRILNAMNRNDAPVTLDLLLAHVLHHMTLIRLHFPVAYCERIWGGSNITTMSQFSANECAEAASEMITMVKQYLRQPSASISNDLSFALSFARRTLVGHFSKFQLPATPIFEEIPQLLVDLEDRSHTNPSKKFNLQARMIEKYAESRQALSGARKLNSSCTCSVLLGTQKAVREGSREGSQISKQPRSCRIPAAVPLTSHPVRNEHNLRKSSDIDPPNEHKDTINIPPSNKESSANLPTPNSTIGEQNIRDGFHYQQQQEYIGLPTMLDSEDFGPWDPFEELLSEDTLSSFPRPL